MERSDVLLPIITLLIGFFLNEVSQWMRTQREDKRVLSRVLSGLLELRHDLVFWRTFKMLLQDLNVTPQQQATVSVYLRQKLLPQFSQWRDRYKESVEELAGVNAVLPFACATRQRMFLVCWTTSFRIFRANAASSASANTQNRG